MTYLSCLLVMLVGSPVVAHAATKIDQTEVSIAEFAKFVAATDISPRLNKQVVWCSKLAG